MNIIDKDVLSQFSTKLIVQLLTFHQSLTKFMNLKSIKLYGILFFYRYRSILNTILQLHGPELIDGLKAFVEAGL